MMSRKHNPVSHISEMTTRITSMCAMMTLILGSPSQVRGLEAMQPNFIHGMYLGPVHGTLSYHDKQITIW